MPSKKIISDSAVAGKNVQFLSFCQRYLQISTEVSAAMDLRMEQNQIKFV